jgi:protein phosphatase
MEQFGELAGADVYRRALQLFRELVLVTIVAEKFLIVHGGLPTEVERLSEYALILSSAQENHIGNKVFEELLWSDPREINTSPPWESSRRGAGRHFGAEVTAQWLSATGTHCVIRGHEPCKGFRLDHRNKIMTLFTSRAPYPAFKAAYLLVSKPDSKYVKDANNLVPFVRFVE